ncbi:type IV secretory system conjugative DNA transfer family protein [Rhodopirellula europaea]|uniref:type IV secretory system conjugative DNA transfer family protein n=1 Tax=Rhodopirellula europaea TaxID=1263866 RepID=UPI003D287941
MAAAWGSGRCSKHSTTVTNCFASHRLAKQHRDSGKAFADARFATAKDFKRAKLLGNTGVVLGSIADAEGRQKIIKDDGEKLILLLGQAGANKTTSTILPTLLPTKPLSHRGHDGLGHSAVVNDPAGEGYAVCKPALEASGYRVIAISPWASLMSERLGVPVEDVGFNVWSELNTNVDSAEWESIVADKSELFIMNRPQDDSQSEFFKDAGRMCFEFFALYPLAAGVKPTPAMMRKMAFEGEEGLIERCEEVIAAGIEEGALLDRAKSLIATLTRAPEEFSGGLSECKRALKPFSDQGGMGAHFTSEGFDIRELKDDQPTIAFVIYPTDKMRSHRRAVNVTFSHMFEQLASDPRIKRKVTFLIDECSSLGYLPNLTNAVTEYRKYGLRFVLAFQQFSGQTEKHYGAAMVKELSGSSAVLWGANIRDQSDLTMFSKYSGTVMVEVSSKTNPNSKQASSIDDYSYTQTQRERPLMREEDVRQMDDSEVAIVHSNLPIVRATKTRYWENPNWKAVAAPNPYQKD